MPVLTYTISGNAGAAGVTIVATGAGSGTATSAADGTYTIGGLAPGVYTITPTLAGAIFTPASLPETIVAADLTGVNFVAQASNFSPPTISDNFNRPDSATLGTNWTPTTNTNSPLAIISHLAVAPVSLQGSDIYSGNTFANNQEASITVGAFGGSSTFLLFVRTDIAVTTGYSLEVNGVGGQYTANLNNASGSIGVGFTFSGPLQPSDVLKIQAVGTLITAFYNGSPISSATDTTTASGSPVLNIDATATQTDTSVSLFTAGPPVFSASGNVGVAGAGATVTLSGPSSATATADGSGNYSFAGLVPGTYHVTPELAGVEFSPTQQTVVVTNAAVTGINFLPFTPSPSGSNSASVMAAGPLFATQITSPRTSVMGTNLGTKITR